MPGRAGAGASPSLVRLTPPNRVKGLRAAQRSRRDRGRADPRRLSGAVPAAGKAPEDAVALGVVGEDDRGVAQRRRAPAAAAERPRSPRCWRRCGGGSRRRRGTPPGPELGHQPEAEHVAVEGDRLRRSSATFRWTWPMTVPAGSPSNGSRRRIVELAEQARRRRAAASSSAAATCPSQTSRGRSQ